MEQADLAVMDKGIYSKPWFVYIAECGDRTLYTGVARDVERRIEEHNTTGRCRYTRCRKPLRLMYKEICSDYSAALKREAEVKRFTRKKKLELAGSK